MVVCKDPFSYVVQLRKFLPSLKGTEAGTNSCRRRSNYQAVLYPIPITNRSKHNSTVSTDIHRPLRYDYHKLCPHYTISFLLAQETNNIRASPYPPAGGLRPAVTATSTEPNSGRVAWACYNDALGGAEVAQF